MRIKESPEESTEIHDEVYIPSTIRNLYGSKNHERAWQREMRHRLAAVEAWLDELERRLTELEHIVKETKEYLKVMFKIEELGVRDGPL